MQTGYTPSASRGGFLYLSSRVVRGLGRAFLYLISSVYLILSYLRIRTLTRVSKVIVWAMSSLLGVW